MKLIYCGGGNKAFYEIATSAGFLYGARLPSTVYGPVHFADQEYKDPNRAAYMAALEEHKPSVATVLDWECQSQLDEVLGWALEASAFVDSIIIIPKVIGGIADIPQSVNGKPVVLGYSVPTSYGGTQLPVWEFGARPVHLLGGSPEKQKNLMRYLNVVSADGNMSSLMATRFCKFWSRKKGTRGHWVSLDEADGEHWGRDATIEAFRRSCINIYDYLMEGK